MHYIANKAEHLYESEIDRHLYDSELAEVKRTIGKTLEDKPQALQDTIIRGKMLKFLQEKATDCQRVGFEESDLTIGEYLSNSEKKLGKIKIVKGQRFGV